MLIEIHAFMVIVHGMTLKNIQYMCDKVLKVAFNSFKRKKYCNILTLTRAFGDVVDFRIV